MNILDKMTYGNYWGGYSTHIQLPEKHIYKLPSNLDYKTIAPLMCAGMTSFIGLHEHAREGMKLAIIGAGGLGHFAIQFAQKMGL